MKKMKKVSSSTKKTVTKKTVLVNFILDKSGSMYDVKTSTISGFNEYINSLKNNKKVNYRFSLTFFDTFIDNKYVDVDIKTIEALNYNTYQPDGNTALYDAVCTTIDKVKKEGNKNNKILTVIMTDGQENSSTKFSRDDMNKLVDDMKKTKKWTFVYLGANQDSWANAQTFGFQQGNVVNYNASTAGVSSAFLSLTNCTNSFSMTGTNTSSTFFSERDKKDIEEEK